MARSSTSFRPGQSGNPAGRGTEDKLWRDAVRRAVKRAAADGKGTQLEALADKLVAMGLAGEISAIQEIGNRLDGKPTQQIDATVRDDPFLQLLTMVSDSRRRQEPREAQRSLDGSPALIEHAPQGNKAPTPAHRLQINGGGTP